MSAALAEVVHERQHLIDISSCQPDVEIDWPAVAGATIDGQPILGVIVKATDGNGGVDPDFVRHVRGIRSTDAQRIAAGLRPLLIAGYHFAHPDRMVHDAELEAAHFIATCDLVGPLAFYMLDTEEARNIDAGPAFVAWVLAFTDACEAATLVLTMVYTGGPFFNEHAGKLVPEAVPRLQRLPLCVAAYVANPDRYVPHPWVRRDLHQRSGDQAPGGEAPLHVPGIGGGRVNVDHDVFEGTRVEFYARVASWHQPLPHEAETTQPDSPAVPFTYVEQAEVELASGAVTTPDTPSAIAESDRPPDTKPSAT